MNDYETRKQRRKGEKLWRAVFIIGCLAGAIAFTNSLWGWKGVGLLVCLFLLWGNHETRS
jgi:fatty acid desaturase